MKKTAWLVDEEHSSISFNVKHMIISTVTGQFNHFEVKVMSNGDNFDGASVECVVHTKNVTTHDDYRDEHLKSEALFDVGRYPKIKFRSERFEPVSEKEYLLRGELKIKHVSRVIDIPIRYLRKHTVNGTEQLIFESNFIIHRDDFDLTYNPLLESGGMVVGKEINVNVYITLVKKGD